MQRGSRHLLFNDPEMEARKKLFVMLQAETSVFVPLMTGRGAGRVMGVLLQTSIPEEGS